MSPTVSIISFTVRGAETAEAVAEELKKQGCTVNVWGKRAEKQPSAQPLEEPLQQWAAREFAAASGLIFVGAVGIAVRAIAPHIKSKTTDPAVVVLDEKGMFSISLLAGHLGGANDLATQIAEGIGATAVVTTATDINQRFAVDQWAKANSCAISSMTIAKEISAAILEQEPVEFFCDYPVKGEIPEDLQRRGKSRLKIAVTIKRHIEDKDTLQLIPRIITLGIGCRRGVAFEKLEAFAEEILIQQNIRWEAVCRIASIDLKKDEQGLLSLARKHGVPFTVYSADELSQIAGDFTPSSFVSTVTGVDNVCERAAMYGDGGALIVKKQAKDGMTVAVACRDFYGVF